MQPLHPRAAARGATLGSQLRARPPALSQGQIEELTEIAVESVTKNLREELNDLQETKTDVDELMATELDRCGLHHAADAYSEVSIEVGSPLRPGVVPVSVKNGHQTAIDGYPWDFRGNPSGVLRELKVVEPELEGRARAKLPEAHQAAAAADATPVTIEPIAPEGVEAYLQEMPPNVEIPGRHGLTLPRDFTAPTLLYAPAKVGKSWAVLDIAAQLATEGLRSLVISTEGSYE